MEGEFINSSLFKIRKTLEKILTYKSQDVLYNIPYNSKLCPNFYKEICKDSCFIAKSPDELDDEEYSENHSIIIDDIYKYLSESEGEGESGV